MSYKLFVGAGLSLCAGCLWAAPHENVEEIVVESSPLHKRQSEIAQFATVLDGDRLRERAGRTIGDTLNGELGVTSTSFGPGVGRPVIRGQGGERVKVLRGGVGALDASTISPDHAVGVEPVLAERIEVIRGPNTLFYGSGAIGGVVNVIDGRIPVAAEQGISGAFEQRHSSVSDEDVSVLKLKAREGAFALYLDGLYRESNETEIDGFAQREADPDEAVSGFIENSSSRAKGGSLGLAWIGEENFLGVSVNHIENNYGIPPGAHEHHEEEEEEHEEEEHEEEAEAVRIDLEQTRYELKGRMVKPLAGIEQLNLKVAYNDYEHVELEGAEVGTMFDIDALEGRIELKHQPINEVHGVLGLQWLDREFSAIGAEAFVPPAETSSYGLFLVQDYHSGDWSYEWGLRYEHQESEADGFNERSHDLFSFSVSAIRQLSENTDLTLVLSRSQRAPAIEELFSNGLHAATNTFEIGNPDLDKETAQNLEISLRKHSGDITATVSLYYNRIDDFIFERATGEVFDEESEAILAVCPSEECTDVFAFSQEDATYRGMEAELEWDAAEIDGFPLTVRLFTDYVRAKLDNSGDVPRMPPLRYGLSLRYEQDRWDVYMRASVSDDQDKPGDNEAETDGFTDVSVGATLHLSKGLFEHTLFVKVDNLLDEEMRNATSFLRDLAPQPGRSITVGYRAAF